MYNSYIIIVIINTTLLSSVLIKLILLVSTFYPPIGTIIYEPMLRGIIGISLSITATISVLAEGFIAAGIMHIFAKVLDGERNFMAILKVSFYSYLPYSFLIIPSSIGLVSPITGISFFSFSFLLIFVWKLHIAYSGIRAVYNLSIGKSFVVLFSPAILTIATIILLSTPLCH